MTPEERQLVDGLFARIRANPPADRDPEAERLIRDLVARDPSAAYALVQMTLVQEHALRLADERIRQLEQAPPPASTGRSFLGGMLPGQRGSVPAAGTVAGSVAPPPFPRQQAAAPFAGQGQPFGAQAAPAGGGFLRNAMATAAGVAGGALLFQGISSLFAGNPGPFGGGTPGNAAAAATPAAEPAAGPWAQTSHQGDGAAAQDPGSDPGSYDQVSDAQQDYSDDSFDGGGDDWSNA